jgi:hypothetical protein
VLKVKQLPSLELPVVAVTALTIFFVVHGIAAREA